MPRLSGTSTQSPQILLAADSLAPTNSGIGRVARLMAKIIVEERANGCSARAILLNNLPLPEDIGLPMRSVGRSRLKFAIELYRSLLHDTHVIYDFAGFARAHPRVPWPHLPSLTFIHGIEVWEGARPRLLKAAWRSAMLVCNSHFTRKKADALHGGFERAHVCWLATDTDQPAQTRREFDQSRKPVALIVGRIDENTYKGHVDLIHCWHKVVSSVPDATLVIVGAGPGLNALRQLAQSTPVASQIEFRGFVAEAEMERTWSEASVFAMPSRGEGFGLVYIEAMRFGLPVIASVHDAGSEINVDGETGYNVNLDSPDELPSRLVELFKNPSKAAEFGNAGQERWRKNFCFSAFRERFLPILNEFLGR